MHSISLWILKHVDLVFKQKNQIQNAELLKCWLLINYLKRKKNLSN